MNIEKVSAFLSDKGYAVSVSNFEYCNLSGCKQLSAHKGKLIKKNLLVFYFPSLPENDADALAEFVKKKNDKNDLCLALCDNCTEINDLNSKTFFTYDFNDFVGIIHFIYHSNDDDKYVYNTDFSYHNSNIIKDIINSIVK